MHCVGDYQHNEKVTYGKQKAWLLVCDSSDTSLHIWVETDKSLTEEGIPTKPGVIQL